MPRSYWGRYLAIAGLTLALTASGYADEPNDDASPQPNAEETQTQTTPIEQPVSPAGEVVTEEPDPSSTQVPQDYAAEEREYAREDLQAQKSMAKWTLLAAIAAFVSAVASGIAVWFVYDTLKETRSANRQARKAHRRELRAYVAVEDGTYERHPDGKGLTIAVLVVNFGQTPAYNLRSDCHVRVVDDPHTEIGDPPIPSDGHGMILGAGAKFICSSDYYPTDIDAFISEIARRKKNLILQGKVIYEDCFDNTHTYRFRMMLHNDRSAAEGIGWFPHKTGNYETTEYADESVHNLSSP